MSRQISTAICVPLLALATGCSLFHDVSPARDSGGPLTPDANVDVSRDTAVDAGVDAFEVGTTDATADLGVPEWAPPGPVFYVSGDGSDANDGTKERPWGTFEHAVSQLQPNDTLYIRGGNYQEELAPTVDGVPGRPIHIRAYPDEEVVISDVDVPLRLEGRLHLRIHGLTLRDPIVRWASVDTSENIVVEQVVGDVTRPPDDETSAHDGFDLRDSRFVRLRNLDLTGWRKTDAQRYDGHVLTVHGSADCLVEDSSLGAAGNAALEAIDNEDVVFRGNEIRNPWESAASLSGNLRVFFYENRILDTGVAREAGVGIYLRDSDGAIVARNVVHGSHDLGIRVASATSTELIRSIRIAHNTVVGNTTGGGYPGGGVQLTDWDKLGVDIEDVVIRNNIIYLNGSSDSGRENQLHISDFENPSNGDVTVAGNIFSNVRRDSCDRDLADGELDGIACPIDVVGIAQADVEWFEERVPMEFFGNSEADPLLASLRSGEVDLRPAADSPAIDSATPLTSVVGSGNSDVVIVGDSLYFHGDLGGMIEPPTIRVGGQPVGVVTVDHESHTMTLDRELEFADGDAVTFDHSGSAPDVGAHERQTSD